MAIDLHDDIVSDFLVEAGEILEQLGPRLLDFDADVADSPALLDTVFRALHTIKGGAGFIGIEPMVVLCHAGEDALNAARQRQCAADPGLVDLLLRVLDGLEAMFTATADGVPPDPPAPDLLGSIAAFVSEASEAPHRADDPQAISEDEFEQLLDTLHGPGQPVRALEIAGAPPPVTGADEMAPEEFESLLDALHGPGRPPGTSPDSASASRSSPPAASPVTRPSPKRRSVPSSVRVDTAVLDRIMNMVGELVLVRNRIATLEASTADEAMAQAVSNLDVVTSALQAAVLRTRMQPIKTVFGRFPRLVRELARSLDKEVELRLEGENTDLDKNMVEALADPLIHLVRNAMDHGIETPAERAGLGKPPTGRITLAAEQMGDQILLTVSDDGAGMSPAALRRKAVEKGVLDADAAARMSDREGLQLIFHAGFSTRAEVSDISGRGVGMDVVKDRITQLNGSVEVESQLGRGTQIRIKVPLTLAIVPTLMVVLGRQIFALPLVNVKEIFALDPERTSMVEGQRTILLRGKPLPIFFLSQWLIGASGGGRGHVVVVHTGTRLLGFVVDQLVGQQEVVIKPLGALLQGTKGLSGATITGDGRIALIIDVPGLVAAYGRR